MILFILAALLASITPLQRDVFNWVRRLPQCRGLRYVITWSQLTDSNLIYDLKPFTGPSSIVTLEDRPRSPPAKLTRFAPDRRDWVLYDTAQENEFLSWWLETDYGQQLTKNGKYKFRWSVDSRSSKVWKHFDQVAALRSGRPKVRDPKGI